MDALQTKFIPRTEKLIEKKCRYVSHLYFLEHCMEEKHIPKGFKLKWTLNLDISDYDECRVHVILQKTSSELMSESIDVCRNMITKTAEIITKNIEHIKVSKNDCNQILSVFRDRETKLGAQMKRNKQHKLKTLRKFKRVNTNNTSSAIQIMEPTDRQKTDLVKIIADGNCFFSYCVSRTL